MYWREFESSSVLATFVGMMLVSACSKDGDAASTADASASETSASATADGTASTTGEPLDPETFCAQFLSAQTCPYGDETQMIWCEWVDITPVGYDGDACMVGEPLGECLAVTGATTAAGCGPPPGCDGEPWYRVVDGQTLVTLRCGGSPPVGFEPCTFIEPNAFDPPECGCVCELPMATTSDGGSTGGGDGDPSYPPPGGDGSCPAQTFPIELPGGSVCAPMCAGAEAACPAPASGDAVPECTPFEQPGGSGTPCTDHADCMGGEACGPADTCVAVAFWACRLTCDGGEMCPDGMTCAGDACGYP